MIAVLARGRDGLSDYGRNVCKSATDKLAAQVCTTSIGSPAARSAACTWSAANERARAKDHGWRNARRSRRHRAACWSTTPIIAAAITSR